MSDSQPFFLKQNDGFAEIKPEDDLLHPEQNSCIPDDSLTETQYFGFSVPDAKIHGLAYMWHHPNLKVVTGGIFASQGEKRYMPEAELCDVRAYMRDTALKNDLHEYRLDNGYGVKIVEPLKRFHMTYKDADRKNSVDLHYEAVSPPVLFGDGNHFEQSMKVSGELVLRGKRYDVDCYNVRDRSWGKSRPEITMALPPYSWATGVFNENFSFNCSVLDQVEGNPELKGTHFALPHERTLNGGWLIKDGTLGRLVRANKRVERDAVTHWPRAVLLELVDDQARTVTIKGTRVTAVPWQIWPNFIFLVSLMRWECDGQVAHGDFQEGYWSDYLNHKASV